MKHVTSKLMVALSLITLLSNCTDMSSTGSNNGSTNTTDGNDTVFAKLYDTSYVNVGNDTVYTIIDDTVYTTKNDTVFALESGTVFISTVEEEIIDYGIAKHTVELFNVYGRGPSALDAAQGGEIYGHLVGESEAGVSPYEEYAWGDIAYTPFDSARGDFKTINNVGRATYLTTTLTSLNGTRYAAITQSDFEDATKSIHTFQQKLQTIAENATATELIFDESTPYFVAKLGNDRGYCLAYISEIDAEYADSSATQTGRVSMDYYYISNDSTDGDSGTSTIDTVTTTMYDTLYLDGYSGASFSDTTDTIYSVTNGILYKIFVITVYIGNPLSSNGLTKHSVALYNVWGMGFTGLDVVLNEGIANESIDMYEGFAIYNANDSVRVDIKTVNNYERASYLLPKLTSLNGARFAAVDSADFDKVVQGSTSFSSKLKSIADYATATEAIYDASSPYFVAKQGNERGYGLGYFESVDAENADSSVNNTGRIDLNYYYISNDDL